MHREYSCYPLLCRAFMTYRIGTSTQPLKLTLSHSSYFGASNCNSRLKCCDTGFLGFSKLGFEILTGKYLVLIGSRYYHLIMPAQNSAIVTFNQTLHSGSK